MAGQLVNLPMRSAGGKAATYWTKPETRPGGATLEGGVTPRAEKYNNCKDILLFFYTPRH